MMDFKYFNYLKTLVSLNGNDSFDDILLVLYDTPFTAYINGDMARINDGLSLRKKYNGIVYQEYCSTLEVIIALAVRMETEFVGDPKFYEIRHTFLMLLDNLKILNKNNINKIKLIIKKFIERDYNINGVGGLFPLAHTIRDQRKVPLWDQMLEWISENYKY